MSEEQEPYGEQPNAASDINFVSFVMSLAHTAAVHFGDIPDPSTGQHLGANLAAAQQMIDILSLIEEKTRGNLSAEERQLLDQVLFELRLRFIEITKKGSDTPSEPKSRIIIP